MINANFYTMALQKGLSAGIINPLSEDMMRSYYAYCALMGYDENCERYIEVYGNQAPAAPAASARDISLRKPLRRG